MGTLRASAYPSTKQRLFFNHWKMKKIIGAIALLLSIAIFLILRQLNHSQAKAPGRKVNVTAIMRENILLTSMLM
jgi:hypothetical protein